jgi:hypothetical protein
MSEDVMKFKTVEFLLEISYLVVVCYHTGVMAVWLPYDLVDDKLKVTADVKPLDPELRGDVLAFDEGLIFYHVVHFEEM